MANVRTPPHDTSVEQSVLGAILIDKDAILNASDILKGNHFYNDKHKYIYEAMIALFDNRDPIDIVTLSNGLKKKKRLKMVGGLDYLTELAEKVPTAANVLKYAKIVRDLANKRDLIKIGSEVVETAFDEGVSSAQALEKAESRIFNLSQQHLAKNFVHIKEALVDSFDRLDELQKNAGGLRGVPTGFADLDDCLAGMHPSNLLILAARPGMGKTALAVNIASNIALQHKQAVGMFSLEMSKEELIDRLLVSEADIDAWRLKTGNLKERDFAKISDAMGRLAEAPIFIDDTPGMNIMEMRTKARRLQMEHDLKAIIVDYLQLATLSYRVENRVQEVSIISQSMKNLARELKVPVLCLSQLSRAVESRGSKEPQLSDLRESGAIEQDADVVMFLYRPDDEARENVGLKIAKHRNGPLRTINLYFKGDRIKFFDSGSNIEKK